jgi:hypothetical protein
VTIYTSLVKRNVWKNLDFIGMAMEHSIEPLREEPLGEDPLNVNRQKDATEPLERVPFCDEAHVSYSGDDGVLLLWVQSAPLLRLDYPGKLLFYLHM